MIHSDRGTQFTSWSFTQRVKEAELMPSVGRTGTALDNAIFEYIESFHNSRWRHSSLNMLTPTEFEQLHQEESS